VSMGTSSPRCKPLIRWAGSKRKLVRRLIPFWGEGFKRYIEPFAGSAALFYAIEPTRALLSDINSELIDTLGTVRRSPRAVYDRLMSFPRGKRSYQTLREQRPLDLSPLDRAARFLFLNRFCFNGLYRTNLSGQFNVPYSADGTGEIPDWKEFLASASLLRRAKLQCGDFAAILETEVRVGDFIYLDPPYAVSNRRIFRQYGPETFGLDDLARLARLLEEIDARGAKFVLSYAICPESKHFFARWPSQKVYAQRNIAGFAKHRRLAAEMIATNIAGSIRLS
jgi:DNA adenine methylase